jgi:DNA-binding transcriptional regulator YiaG
MSETPAEWDADRVRLLRERLGLTQRQLADELGVRQQTVSEWETGMYQPRGASVRMLRLVAERGGEGWGSGQWTADGGDDADNRHRPFAGPQG